MKNPFRSILDSSSRIESNRVILPSMIIRLVASKKEIKKKKTEKEEEEKYRRREEEEEGRIKEIRGTLDRYIMYFCYGERGR